MSQDYSPTSFYVNGTDKRGHREQIRCHFPQDVFGELSAICASKDLPYKTLGDLVRDAVVHRLHQLEEIVSDPVAIRSLQLYSMAEKLRSRKERVAAERELVSSMREAIFSPEQRLYITVDDFDDAVSSLTTPALRTEMLSLRPNFNDDGTIV